MTVDLIDDERTALINLLTVEIEASKFPLSPRIQQPRPASSWAGDQPVHDFVLAPDHFVVAGGRIGRDDQGYMQSALLVLLPCML